MSQSVVFKTLFHNLKLLGFESFLTAFDKKADRLQFDEKMFEKPNEKAFEFVTYFLFITLDKENKKRFTGCFPCFDRKQESDFRKVATDCFKQLEKQHDNQIKFLPVILHNPSGLQFCNLYISLSNYVLAKYMKKRVYFNETYSQLDDLQMKFAIDQSLQNYDKNEQELIKLKSYWETTARYFIERHKTLQKQLQDIEILKDEQCEMSDHIVLIKKIEELDSEWEALYSFASNLTTECKKQLQLIDCEFENSFDVTKITKAKDISNDLDLCDMFNSARKPIENFFTHIDSMSTSKLRDVYSHITVARVQMAKHNLLIAEMLKKIKEEYKNLNEMNQKLRSDLLNQEIVRKRREWFRQRLPTFPKLVFEPKRVENISSLLAEQPKPIFEKTQRMSDVRYSFHFADISTLHYVPPPIMEESCLLSPVRETMKTQDSYDSFDLEKEKEHFLPCD